jgi:hypothetical protein
MIAANHQPQYVPYLGFFHKIRQVDVLIVLDDVQFHRRGPQHRNLIKMQAGTQWLTVPVRRNHRQLIEDVAIDTTHRWRREHWAALQSNYGRAPFWKQLSPTLRPILLEGTQPDLVSLDLDLLRWAMNVLGFEVPMRRASVLGVAPASEPNEHHIALCRAVGADTYLSGPGARVYMQPAKFASRGVSVRFQEYTPREYPQRFPDHGFIPNLSVVDALFNVGSAARELIA